MVPAEPVIGFLCSQIGHDLDDHVRAIHRAPRADALPDNAMVVAIGPGGERRTALKPWGACWDAYWRIADVGPLPAGTWSLELRCGEQAIEQATVIVGLHRLWRETWRTVALEQLERRTRIAHQGRGNGWQDCGCDWQEANSHGACILGLCDVLQTASPALTPDDRLRVVEQIETGCRLLGRLQDEAKLVGQDPGCLIHELTRPMRILARDALWAALAWARAAQVSGSSAGAGWRTRAMAAMTWWQQAGIDHSGMDATAHAWDAGYVPPPERPVGDLALAAWIYAELGDATAAATLADRVIALQVQPGGPGPYGHFWEFSDRRHPAALWTHNNIGPDTGDTGLPPALCLARLLRSLPAHPHAGRWRAALADYAEGWLEPGSAASPFLITPRLWRDGWIHFTGLWHGMNAAYGLAAATAEELAGLLNRPELRRIAHGNRQWIAGLNSGITCAARATGCTMTWPATEPGRALPASMITGVGQRWVYSWLAVPGSICNGFSAGEQFFFDRPADAASDGPSSFTDEDWITHAGGWLMGIAPVAG